MSRLSRSPDRQRVDDAAFELRTLLFRWGVLAVSGQHLADSEEPKSSRQRRVAMKAVEWIVRQSRSLGPYVAVGLFVPGGSIVALLLWTYRSRTAARPTATGSPGHNDELPSCGTGGSRCR